MHAVILCLLLIALASVGTLIARVVKLPLAFVQIGMGVVAASPPFNLDVSLDPELFLLLFIPPLLFSDGWRLSQRELRRSVWSTAGLAVGLVLFTVVVIGYALHWWFPLMPLSVAFGLAAVVSPTDAVAAASITSKVHLPHRIKHLLESEALLNDATGLVAMRFAIAATLSGGFSIGMATDTFLAVAAGGLAVGCVVSFIYAHVHRRVLTKASDATLQTVLTGLLPFAAFAIAEGLHVSGILAAVAAGMMASRLSLLERAHFSARIQTNAAWDVLSFCLNGTIFVLLGLQLPDIFGSGSSGIDLVTDTSRLSIIGDIVLLTLALVAVRFLWLLCSAFLNWGLHERRAQRLDWLTIFAVNIAGVRGAVTLAGVLGIPLLLPNGAEFPSRDLAITLATGVILCSMLIAAVGLPILLRFHKVEDHGHASNLREARVAAIQSTIEAMAADEYGLLSDRSPLMAYRIYLQSLQDPSGPEQARNAQLAHKKALVAERKTIQAMRKARKIDDITARQLLGELDMIEAASMYRPLYL